MRHFLMAAILPLVTSCSTTLPGLRCPQWSIAEWSEVEHDFADAWSYEEGVDPSAVFLDTHRFDVVCVDEAIETRCYEADGEEVLDMRVEGFHPEHCGALEAQLVTGRYEGNRILLSTRFDDSFPQFTLLESSYVHELVHRRLDVEEGDPDASHEKAPGPWTEGHSKLIARLQAGQPACD